MFGKQIKLFTFLGFEIKIDISWLVLAVLVTWSLARGVFPHYYDDISPPSRYWWMGIIGALGLFFSILFHEFFHSLVARRLGLPITGITLFIFGGVAQMDEEPETPKVELLMAVAGPLSSILLSGVFFTMSRAVFIQRLGTPVYAVLEYLALINIVLAIFNTVPAFPLDGGRILRSILWKITGDITKATKIASYIGSGFGLLLIFWGVFSFIGGSYIGGIWLFLIGMFIRSSSQMSYKQVIIRRELQGNPVSDFMVSDVVTVGPSESVERLVTDYFLKYHYKLFPVTENNGTLRGCVTLQRVKSIPPERRNERTVEEIMDSCSGKNTIEEENEAVTALSRMNSAGVSRLMVVDGKKLKGIITLKDMLQFLSLNLNMEEVPENITPKE